MSTLWQDVRAHLRGAWDEGVSVSGGGELMGAAIIAAAVVIGAMLITTAIEDHK